MGCLLVIAAGGTAGWIQSHKLTMRVRFWEQFIGLVSALETEIRYSAGGLTQLLSKHSGDEEALSFLGECVRAVQAGAPFPMAWQDAVGKIPTEYGLTQEDKSLLRDFGGGLGVSDMQGQLSHCQLHQELAAVRLKGAREEKQKKSKLYFMLGLFLGIGIALLIS